MCSLDGKVAVIVGASHGIGKATSRLFAEAGSTVVLAARNEEALKQAAFDIDAPGRKLLALPADITDIAAVERLLDAAVSRFGRLDILINCAGGTDPADWNPLIQLTEEQWDKVMDRNLRAAFFVAQRAAKIMKEQGNGVIINVSSRSASIPNPGNGHFCASKAAVESLTRSMALEWAEYGVRVNAIAPGLVLTEGTQFLMPSEAERRRVADRTPLGRLGTAVDVASLALFLASDGASWITGTTIAINGGSPVPTAFIDFLDRLAERRSK